MTYSRALIAALLGFLVWLSGVADAGWRGIADHFDNRPERAILFIGNSRTSFNDMPRMVRAVADAAHCKERFRIVVDAPNGVTLAQHWSLRKTQDLLAGKWSDVVIQGQSEEHFAPEREASFQLHGLKLVGAARKAGGRPWLYVTWRYSEQVSDFAEYEYHYRRHHGLLQTAYSHLATHTGAGLINVGMAWESLLAESPPFSLYADGNHPTVHGSYLAALVIYGALSGDDVEWIAFAPGGISAPDAQVIRRIAAEHLRHAGSGRSRS